jgi:hypothetical protein
MNFENYKSLSDPAKAVYEAAEKGKRVNAKLNAVVTFVDPAAQLEKLKCSASPSY